MNAKPFVPLLLALVVAACSGATPGATSKPNATSGGGLATAKLGGKVDCAAINTAAQQLLMIQFLAQLNTPDAIEAIKTKAMGNLDLDTFQAAMQQLHALDAYSSALGDPKAAIDLYQNAAKAAAVLFATNPMTQDAIATYSHSIGTPTEFLQRQVAISGAIAAAGC